MKDPLAPAGLRQGPSLLRVRQQELKDSLRLCEEDKELLACPLLQPGVYPPLLKQVHFPSISHFRGLGGRQKLALVSPDRAQRLQSAA